MTKKSTKEELLRMTTEIVSSFLTHNSVDKSEIGALIRDTHSTLLELDHEVEAAMNQNASPFCSIEESVTDDYIICLEDGKKLKMLKRHLKTSFDMTPEEYKIKWNLPADYPIVAPNYAKKRSHYAKQIGLGRKRKAA